MAVEHEYVVLSPIDPSDGGDKDFEHPPPFRQVPVWCMKPIADPLSM